MSIVCGLVAACASGVVVGDGPSDGEPLRPTTEGVDAEAPLLVTDLRYYLAASGPRMIVRGSAAPAKPYTLRVELLDGSGAPAVIPSGDGPPEPSELEIDGVSARAGGFFAEVLSARGSEHVVRRVAVTPRDASGREGERRVADLAPLPERRSGESCDADGFDVCTAGAVCAPGIAGQANHCEDAARVRLRRCAEAGVLAAPGEAMATATAGYALGASLWDPPEGCASPDRRSHPEGLVRLRVATKTPSLTLSTSSPETSFDTVLYVLAACTESARESLACNDDAPGPASALVLRDVEPGDYLVVVDSLSREGGPFTLRATAR